MTSKQTKRLATQAQLTKQLNDIQTFHALGKAFSAAEHTPKQQTEASTMKPEKRRYAERFACPTTGYTDEDLAHLVKAVKKHKAIFTISHIIVLLGVGPEARLALQEQCIENNWSRQKLEEEIKLRKPPRNRGGRRPQIDLRNANVVLEDHVEAWRRLMKEIFRKLPGQPRIWDTLSPHVQTASRAATLKMQSLGDRVNFELNQARKLNGWHG
ncbi:MAG: hypothetical protein U0792_05310 [Gemmataceae bacterium]